MLVQLLVIAGVLLLPLPALVLGCLGLLRHPGLSRADSSDRASFLVLLSMRLLSLALVFLLSGLTLLSAAGALFRSVDLHGMVYVLFALDLLLGALVLLTFGRREQRPGRRRGTPARR